MSISVFSDRESMPSSQELAQAMAARYPLWEALTAFLSDNYEMAADLTFGGKNYGWNAWYRKSGKSLISLYPQKSAFVAQIILGKDQVEKALGLALGAKVGKILRDTPQLHDGRWLFIQVTTQRDVRDIEQLIQLKRRPIKPNRQGE